MRTGRPRAKELTVTETPSELVAMAGQGPLTPAQSAKLRAHMLGLLRAQIPLAHEVVMGRLPWSPTQARLFAVLLDKLVPDLSASFLATAPVEVDSRVLSRDELERLAGG